MSAGPILARYVRDPDDCGAIINLPRYQVAGILEAVVQTVTQGVYLTFLTGPRVESFTLQVPKDEPVLFDEVTVQRIQADADRRWVLTESRNVLLRRLGNFIDGGAE